MAKTHSRKTLALVTSQCNNADDARRAYEAAIEATFNCGDLIEWMNRGYLQSGKVRCVYPRRAALLAFNLRTEKEVEVSIYSILEAAGAT